MIFLEISLVLAIVGTGHMCFSSYLLAHCMRGLELLVPVLLKLRGHAGTGEPFF
jgi:hypothetical protein